MKSSESILRLGTVILALLGSVASAAEGRPASGPARNASGSSSDAYASYLADEKPPATLPAAGFAGYLDDRDAFLSSGVGGEPGCCTSCYGYCDGKCYTRMWLSVDYMMTWTKGRQLPPLVTTGAPGQDGVLGMPTTRILYGNEEIGEDWRSGGRFSLGLWLDGCEQVGVGARFFITETEDPTFSTASNTAGAPLLARPFFNSDVFFGQDSLIISRPGVRRGDVSARSENDVMSLDTYLRWALYECGGRRLDLLAGYQFSRIDDSLDISHNMVQIGGAFPPGTQFAFRDVFDVQNTFHGGSVGLLGEYGNGPLTLSLMSKLAVGNMRQVVRIDGSSSVIDVTGNRADFPGALLALGDNLGTHTDDAFSVMPEVEIKALYRVSNNLDVSLGYSMLYWTNVAMAADQIDTSIQNTPTVNASQILGGNLPPGGNNNPAFRGIDDRGFWAQGLTFGVTFKR